MSWRYRINQLLRRFERSYLTYNLIEISRSALLHNFDLYARLTKLQVIPVLKANAYGHGIELVAQVLKNRTMPYIAVDGYFEALRIHEVSHQPVLVMGAIRPENFAHIKLHNFAFVVQNAATIEALGRRGQPVNIHLEINTGMNRYGIEPAEVASFAKLIKRYPNLELEGVMSHLADSDGLDRGTIDKAVEIFDTAVDQILNLGVRPRIIHLAQSAGSLKARSRHANAMRLGLSLYGINALDEADPLYHELDGLRPALRLTSMIAQTHILKSGDQVSYNYTFTAPRAMRIGVLPLGYHEGIPRSLSNTGTVTIAGKSAPIVGRICMNHTMVSLAGTEAQIGDDVLVISDDPAAPNSVASLARQHNLFSYMHLTSLSPDIRRVLVK